MLLSITQSGFFWFWGGREAGGGEAGGGHGGEGVAKHLFYLCCLCKRVFTLH